jgi:hypothetical protein
MRRARFDPKARGIVSVVKRDNVIGQGMRDQTTKVDREFRAAGNHWIDYRV